VSPVALRDLDRPAEKRVERVARSRKTASLEQRRPGRMLQDAAAALDDGHRVGCEGDLLGVLVEPR
jgi:hypothetical protein